VDVCVYKGTNARGVDLLDDPDVRPDTREWLSANLPFAFGE
jgi:hypothetical protein